MSDGVRRLSTWGFAVRFVAPHLPVVAEILDYPMVKVILDRIDANPGGIFIIQGATQVFKTLVGQLVELRAQAIEPTSSLWYGANEPTAEKIAIEKFNPLFDTAMPRARLKNDKGDFQPALLFADHTKRTTTHYQFPSGDQLLFLSAGVEVNRQSKSATNLYLDEPWVFDPGWIKEIQRRRENAKRFREIHMQTGPTAGSFSDDLWEQSTQEVWHIRCESCRKLFPPEIGDGKTVGGIRYDSGPNVRGEDGVRILSATRATVTLECPRCGHRHANTAHARRVLNAGGVFVAMNANPETHIHGFRVPALPLRDWADIAIEIITAARAMKRGDISLKEDLVRKTEARTWHLKKHLKLKKDRPVGNYKMGDEWADELKDEWGRPWRIATVDVQQDYYVLVIRMWGKASRSRMRFCAKPKSITELNEILAKHRVIRERVFLDARHDPIRVRRTAVQCGFKVFMGDKAQRDYLHPDGLRRIYDEPQFIDAFTGTKDQNAFPACCQILFSKQAALSRVHMLKTELCQPDPMNAALLEPLMTAAEDAPEWYWLESDAHFLVEEEDKFGERRSIWKGGKEDHAGDCEAMGVVAASIANLTGAESLDPPSEEKKDEGES